MNILGSKSEETSLNNSSLAPRRAIAMPISKRICDFMVCDSTLVNRAFLNAEIILSIFSESFRCLPA
jgi:hypothetical protein